MYFFVVLCIVCFVTFSVLFVCICVLNNYHRVATQLQLNISYHITRRGWWINVTPRSLFTPRKDPVPIVKGAGWAPGSVWTSAENLAFTGIQIRYVTRVKILHVATPGWLPQGVFWNKRIKFPHTNLGLASPLVECDSEVIKLSVSEMSLHLLKLSKFLLIPRQKFWTQNPIVTQHVVPYLNLSKCKCLYPIQTN